jgi:hypothetical protein
MKAWVVSEHFPNELGTLGRSKNGEPCGQLTSRQIGLRIAGKVIKASPHQHRASLIGLRKICPRGNHWCHLPESVERFGIWTREFAEGKTCEEESRSNLPRDFYGRF